ncbi:MAG: hypothetical protein RBT69_01220 [Spirochaetia bacterium]|jgi:hypothetical protein|nr:hypothetical protein [Spirochaetia bacterium]
MVELEKEIIGSWFEIRSNIENIANLRDYFKLSDEDLKKTAIKLKASIEGGITEFKKTELKSVYNLIASLDYDTSSLHLIKETANNINCLTYVILIQRLITKKAVKLRAPQAEEQENEAEKESVRKYSLTEIIEIIKEVQELVKKDPLLKSNKNVINILVQVSKYKKENETMKKILPNIPADKKEIMRLNYSKTLNEIISKLLVSYKALTTEDKLIDEKKRENKHILETYDLSIAAELLKKQAETSDRIKTTLVYADREKFRILEIIQTIKQFEKSFNESFAIEEKHYYNMALSEAGKREISRQFCLEIIKILEKHAENPI